MANLEKKIIKQMYLFETKKATFQLVATVAALIVGIVMAWRLGVEAWDELSERQTLDLVTIFINDFETAVKNWDTILIGLYHESPKIVLSALFVLVITIIYSAFYIFRKRQIIKNRLRSLVMFWFTKKIK